MRLIDRTLARDIAVPFILGLAFLFVVLFSLYFVQGTSVLVGTAVRSLDLLRIFLFLTPHFLTMGMPIALLMAVLVALGRMSEDREVISWSSAGISPLRLLAVPLAIGVVITFLGILLAVFAEPVGRRGVRLQINELIKRNVAGDVQAGIFYEDLGDLVLYAEGVDPLTHEWSNVLLHDERDREAPLLLLARHGSIDAAGGSRSLHIRLDDGRVHRSTSSGLDYAVVGFDRADIGIWVEWTLLRGNRFGTMVDEQSIAELRESATKASGSEKNPRYFLMRLHQRFAQPIAALAFSVFGVPIGLARRRSSRAVGLATSTVAAAGYYVLGRVGTALGQSGTLPVLLAANLGNLIIVGLALLMLARLSRVGVR